METFSYKGSHPEQDTSCANNATQNYLTCWNRNSKSLHEANAHLCVELKSKNRDSFATNPNWIISFQEAAFPLHPFWSCSCTAALNVRLTQTPSLLPEEGLQLVMNFHANIQFLLLQEDTVYIILTIYFQLV